MPAASSVSNRPGWYLVPIAQGFRLHLCVSGEALADVRRQIHAFLHELAQPDTVSTAQLLMTELLTNALEACGPHAPVVAVVRVGRTSISLAVHDPDAGHMPPAATAMPGLWAVSGRGLPLVEALGAGPVHAKVTALGKQIICRIPNPAA
ncbi:ATP-binding protein [Kitasatospora cinereorecta]|uniref:ATP-binding protein n=1 Tax=Kitasatospora cinereorecta TaxID=285560 RepID=A0ABW0VI47_9ACTN